jgi:hypothetical protein
MEEGLKLLAYVKADDPPRRLLAVAPSFIEQGGYTRLRCPKHNHVTVTSAAIRAALDAGWSVLPLNPD